MKRKRKKKAKRWLSWRFELFRLTLMAWAMLVLCPVFQIGLRTLFNVEIYWYSQYSREICLVPFCLGLFLSYLTPLVWVWRTHRSWIPQISKANFLVLLILGMLFLLVSEVGVSPGPDHVTSAKMHNHIYYRRYAVDSKVKRG
jgi:hypothetical protein